MTQRIWDFDSTPVKERPRGQRHKLKALYQCRTFEEIGAWIAANGKLIYNDGWKRFPERHKHNLEYDGMKRYKFRIIGCEMTPAGRHSGWRKYYDKECRYGGTPVGVHWKYPRTETYPCFNGNISLKIDSPVGIHAEYRDALAAIGIWLESGGHNYYTCHVFAQDFPVMNAIYQRKLREEKRRDLRESIRSAVGWRRANGYPNFLHLRMSELEELSVQANLIRWYEKRYASDVGELTADEAEIRRRGEIARIKWTLAAKVAA